MLSASSLWNEGYAYGFTTLLRGMPLEVVALASRNEWIGTHESPDYCEGVLHGMLGAVLFARVQLVERERARMAKVDKRPLG